MLPVYQTIQKVNRYFKTNGSRPILVTCDDFNDWVCKYDSSMALARELIASSFAKIWKIDTPTISLIKVDRSHIHSNSGIPLLNFDKECFGSLYLENTKEIDLSMIPSFKDPTFVRKVRDKMDFLKIALFDIWLANEDRNHNNHNLLLKVREDGEYNFMVIDHVNIFNSGGINYGLAQITDNESIINTEIAKLLFGKIRGINNIVNDLTKDFYLCVEESEKSLPQIIELLPDSWSINRKELKSKIKSELFNEEWPKNCESSFRELVQRYLKN